MVDNWDDCTKWVDKPVNGLWDHQELNKDQEVLRKAMVHIWYGLSRNEWLAYTLVKIKCKMVRTRIDLIVIMCEIEDTIEKLYPEEIEVRRNRAIDICRKEKDIINEKKEMKMINDLYTFMQISETIEMSRVTFITVQVIKLVEEKIFEVYPIDIEAERGKYIEICRNEEDILDERENMIMVNNLYRWRWQIRGLWKEAKARRIIVNPRRVYVKTFYDLWVKQLIKFYKERGMRFRDIDELTAKLSKKNKNWAVEGEKQLYLEYEKYYEMKYICRTKNCRHYNKAEIYNLIRNAVYPVKNNKKTVENPYVQKIASLRIKKGYWETVEGEHFKFYCGTLGNWKKLCLGEMKNPREKIKQKGILLKKIRTLFGNIMESGREKLFNVIVAPAKKLVEKEQKARSKKLRRKFRKLVDDKKFDERKKIIWKHDRKDAWNKFINLKENMGKSFKMKVLTYIDNANKRNEEIRKIIVKTANNVQSMKNKKLVLIRRRKELFANMKDMHSSIEENEWLKKCNDDAERIEHEWYTSKVKEVEKNIQQFEQDNTLFIDKRSWIVIMKKKIPIEVKGVDLSTMKYKSVKSILRRGIKVKYPIMLKLKELIQYSVVDVIDQSRANTIYFQLLKSMNMFNRFIKLEEWLLNSKWKDKCIKKISHKHFLGSIVSMKIPESGEPKSLAVIVPNNPDFEIIRKL
jgi:hypothetical protein